MITAGYVRSKFRYDPMTGEFVRLGSHRRWSERPAGTINNMGYRVIYIHGRQLLAHRIAWLYMTGHWPKDELDHINNDRADCRFCNLREASHSENMRNARGSSCAGIKGAYQYPGGWKSLIRINGKPVHLGVFATAEAAGAAYAEAARQHFGEFANDRHISR